MTVLERHPLAELTTLRVGGPAERLIMLQDAATAAERILSVWAEGEPWLLIGGGSNLLIGDTGFEGTVLLMATQGIETLGGGEAVAGGGPAAVSGDDRAAGSETVRLRVRAGVDWDGFVAAAVAEGLSGVEALSGIPGSVGAVPVQNVGAYGQEVSSVIVEVEFLDFDSGELRTLPAAQLGFGYRDSVFKRGLQGVVLSVVFELERSPLSQPIAYAQLASALGAEVGERRPLAEVRDAVLALRASKGMVLDADDPDSVSAGSFFMNPIVSRAFAASLPEDAPRYPTAPPPVERAIELGEDGALPLDELARPVPATTQTVKLSAAWLIERSGISRGYRLPGSRAAVSSKHTLALVNRGGADAAEIAELARFIQTRVLSEFGIELQPEPRLVGVEL